MMLITSNNASRLRSNKLTAGYTKAVVLWGRAIGSAFLRFADCS